MTRMDPTKALTVGDLIEYLMTIDPALPVCHRECSDYSELEIRRMAIEELQLPRGDGYVGPRRPDMPTQTWLVFPGN